MSSFQTQPTQPTSSPVSQTSSSAEGSLDQSATSSSVNTPTLQAILSSLTSFHSSSSSSLESEDEVSTASEDDSSSSERTSSADSQEATQASSQDSTDPDSGDPTSPGAAPYIDTDFMEEKKEEVKSPILDTSTMATASAKIDAKAIRAMGETLTSEANASSQQKTPSQTTLFAVKATSLASAFADSAETLSLSSSTINKAASHFETASALAEKLLALPVGVSSKVTDKMVTSIKEASTQGYAAIISELVEQPSVLADLFTSYSNVSPELATKTSFYLSAYMSNVKSQSSASTTEESVDSALSTDLSYDQISRAIGAFAAAAQNNVATMADYQAFTNEINADIGTFTAEQSTIINANTQEDIQNLIDQQERAKRKRKKANFISDLTNGAMIAGGVIMIAAAIVITGGTMGAATPGTVMLAIGGVSMISMGAAGLAGENTDFSSAIVGGTGNFLKGLGFSREQTEMALAISVAIILALATGGAAAGAGAAAASLAAVTMFSMVLSSTDATTTATEQAAAAAKKGGVNLGPTDRWVIAMNLLVALLPLLVGGGQGLYSMRNAAPAATAAPTAAPVAAGEGVEMTTIGAKTGTAGSGTAGGGTAGAAGATSTVSTTGSTTAKTASSAILNTMKNMMPSLGTTILLLSTIEAALTITSSVIQIQLQLMMMEIADTQEDVSTNQAILTSLYATLDGVNSTTTTMADGSNANMTSLSSGNATMSQNAASSVDMEFSG